MDPQLFGRYQIIRKLAGGGMGRVFLAYDPTLNRQVGLKLIDAGGDRDSIDVVAAERRGATLQDQLAKREASGRVAQIFDVGDREGYFYIAMEYIEGEDLSELVARGPLDPQRAVGIALDVLDVLAKAHTFQTVIEERTHRGIIHGDIKPRNIRLTGAGQVKVLDFGIAKAVSMTRSITFNQFGSVPYSSPERLQTGDMDARSDVWSVAIVLFEMLTGKPYFEAEASSKLEWIIRNYRALQPAIAELPSGLREILSRALDPDLSKRFASAAALQSALHEWRSYAYPNHSIYSADLDATRRTAYPNPDERTVRAAIPAKRIPTTIRAARFRIPESVFHLAVPALVALFLIGVFLVVYEIRMWNNAKDLRSRLDSGQVTLDVARTAYQALAKKSLFSWPLSPARKSLLDRYVAEADRVIADYREESESTPVNIGDWKRAQAALSSAAALAPEDGTIRGKSDLVDGYLQLSNIARLKATRDYAQARSLLVKNARGDFEQARNLLPHAPDPHLGLALIQMREGDLNRAEEELQLAKRNGVQPGRRQQRALADGYKTRGERWLAEAKRADGLSQMQDALKHADSDLAHAQDLYNSVAPLFNGVQLAEKVSLERDKAAKSLAEAEQAAPGPADAPKESQQ
ncbi:MAG TPA: serine/threonine-protein kinase [Bryobacteraceae bacterium]|nr:serine/threonine-protein kinase [Bryobacteraceae bacterium]